MVILVIGKRSGCAFIWKLDEELDQLSLQTDTALDGHLDDGVRVHRPKWRINDDDWDAPANATTWTSNNESAFNFINYLIYSS